MVLDHSHLSIPYSSSTVAGDKIVTSGSIVTFVLKLRAAQPATDAKANDEADKENVKPVANETKEIKAEEEEEEEALDEVDKLLGAKKSEDEEPTEKSLDVHAPYFPVVNMGLFFFTED